MEVADRLFKAIELGDIAAVENIYAPDAKIWHNFDQKIQTATENLAVLGWMVQNMAEIAYGEVRRQPTPSGFVQQHVLTVRVKSSGRRFSIPSCIIATVKGAHITRLDEYLDSAQIAALQS